ncbi:DUF3089 domain-containing protein [Sphingomonas crusticola]|uniref:DUF3089 domain-containing protein n=1 Tax=Sphingomonas crusticola TaxID=1697973 RepID=UPI000E24C838|nr:DUF3089 domain-containing protein [Sphingomonas crusticola]
MLARRFLYIIAALIIVILAIGLAWSLMQDRLMRLAFVPNTAFSAMPDATAPDYAKAAAWLARPDFPDDPTRWTPPGATRGPAGQAAIFYVAPTTYLDRNHWNAPLNDGQANYRLGLFARSQASAFNDVGQIWAPRYRQATLGAFLAATDQRSAKAIDFAYRDVARAFDAFLAAIPKDRPIILVGHSQGSLHLLRLLREKVAGSPLARRIVAVYAVGWPISTTADLPALGLPACATAGQAGCILGWQSFAEPAEPRLIDAYFDQSKGLTGAPRKGTSMLCVNPLTGVGGGAAPATVNRGALVPHADLAGGDLVSPGAPARCSAQGLLLIGPPPGGYGTYVLPGNNYHVFDYALFWRNIRDDAAARLKTFLAR